MGLLEENANAGPELFGLTVRVRNSREFKRFCLKKQSFRQTCTVRKAVIKMIIVVSELILFLKQSVGELRASNKTANRMRSELPGFSALRRGRSSAWIQTWNH